jgi:hypothetical protein
MSGTLLKEEHSVAIPQKKRPTTLEEAVAELKRDPLRAVQLHVSDVDVEVHLVNREERKRRLGDFMAEGGGWKGESAEEILRILREARDAGGTTEPPRGL